MSETDWFFWISIAPSFHASPQAAAISAPTRLGFPDQILVDDFVEIAAQRDTPVSHQAFILGHVIPGELRSIVTEWITSAEERSIHREAAVYGRTA